MRQALAVGFFDEFGGRELNTEYFDGNAASRRVSEMVGYTENGVNTLVIENEVFNEHRMRLVPKNLVRPAVPVEVEGAAALREFLGL